MLTDALIRIADEVVLNGVYGSAQYPVSLELLLGRRPKLRNSAFQIGTDETAVEFATRIVTELAHTVVAIQVLGSCKTFTGAKMICELVRNGARVGITALSYRVIRHFDAVMTAAREARLEITCIDKVKN